MRAPRQVLLHMLLKGAPPRIGKQYHVSVLWTLVFLETKC